VVLCARSIKPFERDTLGAEAGCGEKSVVKKVLLMPPRAHSISVGRPTAPDTAPFPVLHGLLESAKGIAQYVVFALVISFLMIVGS
jgi:hypothetical protein